MDGWTMKLAYNLLEGNSGTAARMIDDRLTAIERGKEKGCDLSAAIDRCMSCKQPCCLGCEIWESKAAPAEKGSKCDMEEGPCACGAWHKPGTGNIKAKPAEKEKPCNETCAKNIVPGIPCTDLKHGYSCWVSSKPAEAEEGEVVWVKGHLSKDGRYVDIARTRFVPVAIMTNELDPAELRTDLIDPTDPARNDFRAIAFSLFRICKQLEAENSQLRAENETLKIARAKGERMWDDIIKNADGSLNEEQIMKELSDYSFVLSQVPKVYCYITGDKWSKPNYYADDIIREAEDYIQERCDEAVKDENEPVISQLRAVKVAAEEYRNVDEVHRMMVVSYEVGDIRNIGQYYLARMHARDKLFAALDKVSL